jgi:DNA processing protein
MGAEDDAYPENLRLTRCPPVALAVQGELKPSDSMAVAIVGTRKASVYGLAVARQLARSLAASGVTIVSGGAHGIDTSAHKGALEGGGRTIVVLGCGIDRVYPAANRDLFRSAAKSGAVVSQFACGTKPDYWRFPIRNEVIAGLSRAVVVVEAPEGSGSLSTASSAAHEGRHVFAATGPVDEVSFRGSFALINDGATLFYSPDQILDVLGLPRRSSRPEKTVSRQQQAILAQLSKSPELADNIGDALGLAPGIVMAELTALELEGLVARYGSGYVKL